MDLQQGLDDDLEKAKQLSLQGIYQQRTVQM
jgi:hypothetical protein